ncbi:hypothetical protein BD779DRAFT_1743535 [Infundibulicybe gibba]|nr:hypothetical protein BD779DRAFT_1743535 [Infundibulicybe gibba]
MHHVEFFVGNSPVFLGQSLLVAGPCVRNVRANLPYQVIGEVFASLRPWLLSWAQENGICFRLTVVDAPSFGDFTDNVISQGRISKNLSRKDVIESSLTFDHIQLNRLQGELQKSCEIAPSSRWSIINIAVQYPLHIPTRFPPSGLLNHRPIIPALSLLPPSNRLPHPHPLPPLHSMISQRQNPSFFGDTHFGRGRGEAQQREESDEDNSDSEAEEERQQPRDELGCSQTPDPIIWVCVMTITSSNIGAHSFAHPGQPLQSSTHESSSLDTLSATTKLEQSIKDVVWQAHRDTTKKFCSKFNQVRRSSVQGQTPFSISLNRSHEARSLHFAGCNEYTPTLSHPRTHIHNAFLDAPPVRHVASASNFCLGHPVIDNGMGTSAGIQKVSPTRTHMGCNLPTHRFKIARETSVSSIPRIGDPDASRAMRIGFSS